MRGVPPLACHPLACQSPAAPGPPPPTPAAPPTPLAQKTRLTYRELVKDPQGEVSRLYRFLGVDPKPPVRVNATMKMDTASRLADEIEKVKAAHSDLADISTKKVVGASIISSI